MLQGRCCRTQALEPAKLIAEVKLLVKRGFFYDALQLFSLLRASNTDPTNLPIVYALKACGSLPAFNEGLSIHTFITKAGLLDQNLTSMNSLIEMYSSFARVDAARQVFDGMPERNTVSWNMMMFGYGTCGQPAAALDFCNLMKKNRVSIDTVGFKIILPICGKAGALQAGESVHCHLIISGLLNNTALATAIADMYANCRELCAAEKAFEENLRKDAASWNAMIANYSQARKFESSLELLNQMLAQGHNPSRPTILPSLQACTQLSSLKPGMAIHGLIISNGLYQDVSIKGLVIDMYTKCGEMGPACRVFAEIANCRVNTWSCMINGLGIHGRIQGSLMLFFQMLKNGVEPDDVVFLVLLSSCSHWGSMEEGWKVFFYMFSQFGIRPSMEHWVAMVDLVGRGGWIDEALGFMNEMPLEVDSGLVGAFLGACRIHGNQAMGKEMGDWLIERGCSVAGFYKLLVGIGAGGGNWDEVIRIREVIERRRLRGNSGTSLVEGSYKF
ncbi:Pentatricopeptide repeat-containing protein [Platanthera guangdongensis]|uniref:Pentatricopeptide repeat-containing protein n=1 Tax=Platanthera guangdongensis TaxID=2320717 RepID=A0ABR2MQG2_9ASPA